MKHLPRSINFTKGMKVEDCDGIMIMTGLPLPCSMICAHIRRPSMKRPSSSSFCVGLGMKDLLVKRLKENNIRVDAQIITNSHIYEFTTFI